MAVFTLETDYSGETGYPFDDSRQIGKRVSMGWWFLRLSAKIVALLRLSAKILALFTAIR